jgi:ParB-like chromosome segregation protein Spo0J
MPGGSTPIVEAARELFAQLDALSFEHRVEALNELRLLLREHSPFRGEPVDCVLWVAAERVRGNDYNPNTVAPPEMKLLEHSVREDGFTQPIVSFKTDEQYEVVDGFHRHRVGREVADIQARLCGYLPVVVVNDLRGEKCDRMSATVRHNRARGRHRVDAMSDIVVELTRRGWKEKRIANELGMDADEVLRLKQITGLAELFKNSEYSEAWEPG